MRQQCGRRALRRPSTGTLARGVGWSVDRGRQNPASVPASPGRSREPLYEKRHHAGLRRASSLAGKRVGCNSSREFESRRIR